MRPNLSALRWCPPIDAPLSDDAKAAIDSSTYWLEPSPPPQLPPIPGLAADQGLRPIGLRTVVNATVENSRGDVVPALWRAPRQEGLVNLRPPLSSEVESVFDTVNELIRNMKTIGPSEVEKARLLELEAVQVMMDETRINSIVLGLLLIGLNQYIKGMNTLHENGAFAGETRSIIARRLALVKGFEDVFNAYVDMAANAGLAWDTPENLWRLNGQARLPDGTLFVPAPVDGREPADTRGLSRPRSAAR